MSFKKKLQERIQKNAVRSDLSWKDNEGNTHTETVLLKRSKIPVIGDWARIYPPINEEGKISWVNLIFGGKRNLIKLIVILLIVAMVFLQFSDLFQYIEVLKSSDCYHECINQSLQTQTPSLIPFR